MKYSILLVLLVLLSGCKNSPGEEKKLQPKADQRLVGGKVTDCKT